MNSPLEKEIEKKIGAYAKSKGCLYYKFTSPANRAVPDRMIITPNGTVGFLEIKRAGCKPTLLQMRELTKLKGVGCNVGWCDNVLDGQMFIDRIMNPSNLRTLCGEGLV